MDFSEKTHQPITMLVQSGRLLFFSGKPRSSPLEDESVASPLLDSLAKYFPKSTHVRGFALTLV